MGFDYLKNKEGEELNWSDISRDERRFCADLVFQLEKNNTQKEFVDWIIKSNNLNVKQSDNFEIDFEVCFYRDLIFNYELNKTVKLGDKAFIKGLLKRTFDICIFLPDDIIIIEAKAAENMGKSQMIEFKYDKLAIEICLSHLELPQKKVHIIGLISEEYSPKTIELLNEGGIYFDGIINWLDIEKKSVLGYKPRKKLKTVYSETSNRKKLDPTNHLLIEKLTALTNDMAKEKNASKRNPET